MLGGVLMTAVGVSYLIFEETLLADPESPEKRNAAVKGNEISRTLIGIQVDISGPWLERIALTSVDWAHLAGHVCYTEQCSLVASKTGPTAWKSDCRMVGDDCVVPDAACPSNSTQPPLSP